MRSLCFLLLAATFGIVARAQPTPELPSSKQEVSNALAALRDRYGLDAVKLESFLLQYAIDGGAVLTTSVGIEGVETIDDYDYLLVDFDTGIIYPHQERPGSHAAAKVWSDVVEPTLRQFRSMELSADGIFLRVRFRRSGEEGAEVLRKGRQDSLPVDVVSFRILCREVVDAVRQDVTSKEFLQRAFVRLNDEPVSLSLHEITPAPRPDESITPALPFD